MRDLTIGPLRISGNIGWWRFVWGMRKHDGICGLFRNRKEVIPGRWGFWFLGIEVGSRNPGNWFGVFLKRVGLWPF